MTCTHITDDNFEIKLIARLLNQIYVIEPPMLPLRYDDAPQQLNMNIHNHLLV